VGEGEMTQNNGHYAIEDYSRSPISAPIGSRSLCDLHQSRTVSELSRSIGQINAFDCF